MSRLSDLLNNPLPSKRQYKERYTSESFAFDDFDEASDGDFNVDQNSLKSVSGGSGSGSGGGDITVKMDKEALGAMKEDDDVDDLGTPLDDDLDDDEELADVDDDGDLDDDDLDDIDDDDDFDDDDFGDVDGLDDLSDEELDQLSGELDDEQIDDVIDDSDDYGDDLDAECGDCGLDECEEDTADDLFAAAATPMVMNDALSTEEKARLFDNPSELRALVNEGLMFESDIEELKYALVGDDMYTEGMYQGPTKIKWSIDTIKARLFGTAIFACAAAKNDRDLVKYRKLRKQARIYKAKLRKKYKSAATARMKVLFKRLKASKSKSANKAAATIK